ncbi:MAG TPA: hypothetical protein VL989_02290 [Candidatus Sulfotelmatobacter sp.]|nr:hypothetical protein [Candidatus Sulfotelmatobacter sp.]
MTATNHALTGAVIGLVVVSPVIAIPAAFLSHYALDMIPHFKASLELKSLVKTKAYTKYLITEASLCFLIVLGLFLKQPYHWQIAIICAFLGAAPDLLQIRRYLYLKNNKKFKENWSEILSRKIQWFERPIGAVVEAAWFIGMGTSYLILTGIVKN